MPTVVRTTRLSSRPVSTSLVRRRGDRMLTAMKLGKTELSVLLCDDSTIRALNRDYRRKDEPTDVLAFAMQQGEGPAPPGLLGDVVISIDTARRQARQSDRAIAFEVTFLLAHGLLHLLGYDHRTKREERVMSALTDGLVAAALGPAKR